MIKQIFTLVIFVAICNLNISCSNASSKNRFAGPLDYERISDMQSELKNSLQEYPLSFVVTSEEDTEVARRVKIFFNQYIKVDKSSHKADSRTSLFNANSGNYIYSVEKTFGRSRAVLYRISCKTIDPAFALKADFNARNLSRFLKDGIIERSLLSL